MAANVSVGGNVLGRQISAAPGLLLLTLMACMGICGWLSSPKVARFNYIGSTRDNDARIDDYLQNAAISALEGREGTIIVIDPQTGRIRAVVNSELAFEKTFAPGSTIKPFAALAAMRSGVIDHNSRTLCRQKYSHEDFHTVCSHPRDLPPLNAAEAIAYSCNYFFGKLGERLTEAEFTALLSSFGFGKKSGVNADRESIGKLSRGDWHPQNALGDGNYLQVTPIQLVTAYSALVNGGLLLRPRIAAAEGFAPEVRNNIRMSVDERELIFEGLRGAIRFGTAERAGLNSLRLEILGKTGTSTPIKGFRTQGWFVGFVTEPQDESINPKLGVLVFLKRGHGADAAEVSRGIFEEYARISETTAGLRRDAEKPDPYSKLSSAAGLPVLGSNTSNYSCSQSFTELLPGAPESPVRVHLARENLTHTLSLEDYVTGVVAAEGSMETNLQALKALAVTSRTYALKNSGRHAAEGYDFCSTTHCQRFSLAADGVRQIVRKAVAETKDEVLIDDKGELAAAYFSASCGGETANIVTLWGASPQPYLRGVRDEYCVTMPHSHWTDLISASDLMRALQSDHRTDVGGELKDIVVQRRDKTGRAEQITIVGQQQRTVRGWDFKIIIGRALGWDLLKSSRFQVSRKGSDFVFRGSGFGHGLGLCQEGAHVMAERGFTYREILGKYFPSVIVGTNSTIRSRSLRAADLLWSGASLNPSLGRVRRLSSGRRSVSSEHFRLTYPVIVPQRDAEYLLQLLESIRSELLRRPDMPHMQLLPFIEVSLNETTGDFVGRTGQPWWAAAASQDNRIELQPIALLKRRGILATTLRHELVHNIIDAAGSGQTPRWLAEGLALYLAGEGRVLSRYQSSDRISLVELERRLGTAGSEVEMRALYAAAYVKVRSLIRAEGETGVWQLVRH